MRSHRFFLLLVTGCTATAAAQTRPARVLGVYDGKTGDPIEGAEVADITTRVTARTTRTGTVSLAFIEGDGSLVRITKIGYVPTVMLAKTGPLDTVPMTVLLTPAIARLPTVVTHDSAPRYVSPGLRSFEERRATSVGGQFIPEAELRKAESRKLSDVMRHLNGLKMACGANSCAVLTSRQTKRLLFQGGTCFSDVYLDGALVMEGSSAASHNIDEFAVRDIAGVEFYSGPASIPTQYNKTGGPCGVVLLWSRER